MYELLIEVQNEKDETVEVVPYPIGFRKIELKDGKMLLNGKRLIINGVNRHEWNARSGRCIPKPREMGHRMYPAQSYQCSQNLSLSRSYLLVLQV